MQPESMAGMWPVIRRQVVYPLFRNRKSDHDDKRAPASDKVWLS
jgi:hypothetical protein